MSGRQRRYRNRTHAGEVLAEALRSHKARSGTVVLALPRGGVPVAAPVARAMSAPLGVLLVRKLGVPGRPELAMGALASVGGRLELFRNEPVIASVGVSAAAFEEVRVRELRELERRLQALGDAPIALAGQEVVVVDDGLATGSTMLAAVRAVRSFDPAAVVVAVPVGAPEAVALLRQVAEVVCPWAPVPFQAVGLAYSDFTQVSDSEVQELLRVERERALSP